MKKMWQEFHQQLHETIRLNFSRKQCFKNKTVRGLQHIHYKICMIKISETSLRPNGLIIAENTHNTALEGDVPEIISTDVFRLTFVTKYLSSWTGKSTFLWKYRVNWKACFKCHKIAFLSTYTKFWKVLQWSVSPSFWLVAQNCTTNIVVT